MELEKNKCVINFTFLNIHRMSIGTIAGGRSRLIERGMISKAKTEVHFCHQVVVVDKLR